MTKYLTPKKYHALPESQRVGWVPLYKEYQETTSQEMEVCDCCGSELGMHDVTTRTPIGEPYRYQWTIASELQAYYSKQMLEMSQSNVILSRLKQ